MQTAVVGLFGVNVKLVKITLACDFWSEELAFSFRYNLRSCMTTFKLLKNIPQIPARSKIDGVEAYRSAAHNRNMTRSDRLSACVVYCCLLLGLDLTI
jgi:hypothetical protein